MNSLIERDLKNQIETCNYCIEELSNFNEIEGIKRFRRSLISTKMSLEKSLRKYNSETIEINENINNDKMTNITIHYLAMVKCLKMFDITAVYRSIQTKTMLPNKINTINNKQQIHLLNENQSVYITVIARDPLFYHNALVNGATSRNEMQKVKTYVNSIKQLTRSTKPTIIFFMFKGCTHCVKYTLEKMGIVVETEKLIDDPQYSDESLDDITQCDSYMIKDEITLSDFNKTSNNVLPKDRPFFLDVTAMMALISESTHIKNLADVQINSQYLYNQIVEELKSNTKSFILKKIEGKPWFTCKTAWESMCDITKYVAGDNEKKRLLNLSQKITIIDDLKDDEIFKIHESKNVTSRTKIIFGSACNNNFTIVTANRGFVNSCSTKGICLPVLLHNAVSLSEKKIFYK